MMLCIKNLWKWMIFWNIVILRYFIVEFNCGLDIWYNDDWCCVFKNEGFVEVIFVGSLKIRKFEI